MFNERILMVEGINLKTKYRKDRYHGNIKGIQSINSCSWKPATGDAAVSLVLLLPNVPALLILILTRGQLGYQPSREQPSSSGKVEVQPIL